MQRHELKQKVAERTSTRGTFRNIHEVQHVNGRVLMLEIRAACRRRERPPLRPFGRGLGPLPLNKRYELRRHSPSGDWTAQTDPDATVANIDTAAIAAARRGFATQHPSIPSEVIHGWSEGEFHSLADLTRRDEGTPLRAAPARHARERRSNMSRTKTILVNATIPASPQFSMMTSMR